MCSLDNYVQSCSPEVRETFLSELSKNLFNYSFYFVYLPQRVLLDLLEAILLTLPINICQYPRNFPQVP